MFLSKDFLDDGAPPQREDQMPMRPATSSGTGSTTSAAFGTARPSSFYGRPATSSSFRSGSGFEQAEHEEPECEATPSSAATLRQKMLQQRQRALAKQRAGPVGGIVMANQAMPVGGPAVSSGFRSPTSAASRPSTAATPTFDPSDSPREFAATPTTTTTSAAPPPPPPPPPPPAAARFESSGTGSLSDEPPSLLQSVMNSMMLDENGGAESVVVPNPMSAEEIRAEEARRRQSLAQRLDESGLCPVFDPGPSAAGPSASIPKPIFNVASIPASELKNFLLNSSPKSAGMIECRIIREKGGLSKLFPKYILETDAGMFLMSAKKQTQNKTSKYVITMNKNDDNGKDQDSYLGKLRSNFLGLEFVCYGDGLNPKKMDSSMSQAHALQLARQELLAVQYSSSLWGTKPRGPRKMGAIIPRVQPSGERLICRTLQPETEGLIALSKASNTTLIHSFHNKPPKWNEQVGAYVLNFNKRVTQASVKNFQLTTSDDPDTVFLQFGRVGKDVFNMDFRFPFSPLQAFAICLSSFDYKLCCE